jgi:ABC-type dipeptide/oligopeptide/nickel transport system ATPase subunit
MKDNFENNSVNHKFIKFNKFFDSETELLLKTENLSFGYSSLDRFLFGKRSYDLILNKCSINVPKGKIYSLLGSSGCGKTTLLKCILGINKVKFGSIKIFINKTDSTEIKGIFKENFIYFSCSQ